MKIVILRGCSGAGKTTLANKLSAEAEAKGERAIICSADDFMMVADRYEWKSEKLAWAHRSCQEKARKACEEKTDLIVISNTNLGSKDRKPYIRLAEEFGYESEVMMVGDFTEEFAKICAARNVHNVPEAVILSQAARFRGTEGLKR